MHKLADINLFYMRRTQQHSAGIPSGENSFYIGFNHILDLVSLALREGS